MAKWFVKKKKVNIDYMCSDLNIHKPLAYALNGRGIRDKITATEYFNSINSDFEDITDLKDVVKAFDIIIEEIHKGSPICVYGDYDADGVMSTVILCKALSHLGADVTYFIPNRVEDGYGLSNSSVVNIAQRGIKLIITCDNGISAIEQIELAKKFDMRVVVLDHHEPKFTEQNGIRKDIVPDADAVVDAKLEDSGYIFKEMCAGGLCYRFSKGLFEYLNKDFSPLDNELITFAGIATICDVVDLVGENRTLAQRALRNINNDIVNIGLKALVEIKAVENINSYHIGFIIGPCINASGRLDTAAVAVDLFLTSDMAEAHSMAKKLSNINDERKNMTNHGVENVISQLGNNPQDKILVIYNDKIHESIAGIIAGRVREVFNRPAIILTKSKDGVKGSARSIEAYNIFEGLYAHSDLLINFGGHSMAAGLSLSAENIDTLRKRLNDDCNLSYDDLVEVYTIDGALNLEDITEEAVDELQVLNPFGKANESPLYGSTGLRVVSFGLMGKEKRFVRIVLRDDKGYEIRAVDFSNYDKWEEIIDNEGYSMEMANLAKPVVDIVYQLDINEYNGYRNPQLKIKDVRSFRGRNRK